MSADIVRSLAIHKVVWSLDELAGAPPSLPVPHIGPIDDFDTSAGPLSSGCMSRLTGGERIPLFRNAYSNMGFPSNHPTIISEFRNATGTYNPVNWRLTAAAGVVGYYYCALSELSLANLGNLVDIQESRCISVRTKLGLP